MTRKLVGALPVCALIVALGSLLTACEVRYIEPRPRVVVTEPVPEPVYVSPPDTTVYYMDEGHPGPIHTYHYYPDVNVYFDPIGVSWYWLDGRNWRHGRRLPGHIRINERSRIHFRSDARRPYDVHDRVRGRYQDRGRGPDFDRNRGRISAPGHVPAPRAVVPSPRHVPEPRVVAPVPRHVPGPRAVVPSPRHVPGPRVVVPSPRTVVPSPRHVPTPPGLPGPRDLPRVRDDRRSNSVPVPPGLPRPPGLP